MPGGIIYIWREREREREEFICSYNIDIYMCVIHMCTHVTYIENTVGDIDRRKVLRFPSGFRASARLPSKGNRVIGFAHEPV